MTKQFWIFLLMGLAVVCAGIYGFLFLSRGAHLELKGEILKVRVLALNANASLVMVDFRVSNPSDVPFVVRTVRMQLDPAVGEQIEGVGISKPDVDNVFKYEKLLGPKYTAVLSIRDRVGPHQTVDRMVGARFELPESGIDKRKNLRVHIEDVDGPVADVVEKK